ncbi:hypothetical protein Glove_345g20 [Diversispora epigaea]|uniref:Uncharacterized protein n=1 Tax=Diversispora epigaea TaxID=1348612 RepID=A0A397HFB5_9GLOM|nr:hypothetical protein Glove_345g20 [Diversispora epigaea]
MSSYFSDKRILTIFLTSLVLFKWHLNEHLIQALSHVSVFREGGLCGLYKYFDDKLWKELFVEFQKLCPYLPIPDKIYDLFTNIIKRTTKDYEDYN